jgi:release factor glutamine methyltransferase
MRPGAVVRRGADYLARHDVENPLPAAERLMMHVLGTDRAGIYRRSDDLTTAEAKAFGRLLCRRCTGTPVQHLTGTQGFRRLLLAVRPGVFVPRPETEAVVEAALEAIVEVPEPVIVDVGTGTGAVALAIKDERPDARVIALDLSPAAVGLARENADRLGLAIDVLEGDLLAPVPTDLIGAVDLIVSNPPYVAPESAPSLPADVLADPPFALFGGPHVYVQLFCDARAWMRSGGSVVAEVDESRGGAVAAIAVGAGFVDARVKKDLSGRDRVVIARHP